MEQRWSFLAPWCGELEGDIHQVDLQCEDGLWGPRNCLQVVLPTRGDSFETEDEFQIQFQKSREALALLAAVAHVDYRGWIYLLTEYCKVKLKPYGATGRGYEIPAEFMLTLDFSDHKISEDSDTFTHDLVRLCGVQQWDNLSRDYLEALSRIASMDKRLKPDKPGIEVEILVRVYFWVEWDDDLYDLESMDQMKDLSNIGKAETLVLDEWNGYESSLKTVAAGSLHCTFMLRPMVVDFTEVKMTSEFAETIETLALERTPFWYVQAVCLDLDAQLAADGIASRKAFGQIMASLFGTIRRPSDEDTAVPPPPQIEVLPLHASSEMAGRDLEAMCSAIVVNGAVKHLSLAIEVGRNYEMQWKWLAYALFSVRARECSVLESVEIKGIERMSAADIDAFGEIFASEYPERDLVDCPRGLLDERNATLNVGASINWSVDDRGEPVASITLQTALFPVRTRASHQTRYCDTVLRYCIKYSVSV